MLLPTIRAYRLCQDKLHFSIRGLVYGCFVLCLGYNDLQGSRYAHFFYQCGRVTHTTTIRRSFPIKGCYPRTSYSNIPICRSTSYLSSSLLQVIQSIVRLRTSFQRLFRYFFLQSMTSSRSWRLIFHRQRMSMRIQIIQGNDRQFERANARRHSCPMKRYSRRSIHQAFCRYMQWIIPNIRLLDLRLYRLHLYYRGEIFNHARIRNQGRVLLVWFLFTIVHRLYYDR